MPITPDRMKKLREFGLSEYAARSYLALLDLGVVEARDVSNHSKVPQAKIYHVLDQLHEKGLVVILPEFPKKYAPVAFEEFVDRILKGHQEAAATIERERHELSELFRLVGDTDVTNRGSFTIIRGRRNVLAKLQEMLQASTESFIGMGTTRTAGRFDAVVDGVRQLRARGVVPRILLPADAEGGPRGVLPSLAELRVRALPEAGHSEKVVVIASDRKRALIIHLQPDDGSVHIGKDSAFYVDQEAMVALLQALVESEWARARPHPLHAGKSVPIDVSVDAIPTLPPE